MKNKDLALEILQIIEDGGSAAFLVNIIEETCTNLVGGREVPIPIISLYQEEFNAYVPKDSPALEEEDFENLRQDLSDALFENGFWDILKIVVETYCEGQEEDEDGD